MHHQNNNSNNGNKHQLNNLGSNEMKGKNYTIVDSDFKNKINDLVSVLDLHFLQIQLAFEPLEHDMDAIHAPIDVDKNISRRFELCLEAKIDDPSLKWILGEMSKYDQNNTSFITNVQKVKEALTGRVLMRTLSSRKSLSVNCDVSRVSISGYNNSMSKGSTRDIISILTYTQMIDQVSTNLNYLKDKIVNVHALAITDSNNKIYQIERERKHRDETIRKYLSTLSHSCIVENYLVKGEQEFYQGCMTVLETPMSSSM